MQQLYVIVPNIFKYTSKDIECDKSRKEFLSFYTETISRKCIPEYSETLNTIKDLLVTIRQLLSKAQNILSSTFVIIEKIEFI